MHVCVCMFEEKGGEEILPFNNSFFLGKLTFPLLPSCKFYKRHSPTNQSLSYKGIRSALG